MKKLVPLISHDPSLLCRAPDLLRSRTGSPFIDPHATPQPPRATSKRSVPTVSGGRKYPRRTMEATQCGALERLQTGKVKGIASQSLFVLRFLLIIAGLLQGPGLECRSLPSVTPSSSARLPTHSPVPGKALLSYQFWIRAAAERDFLPRVFPLCSSAWTAPVKESSETGRWCSVGSLLRKPPVPQWPEKESQVNIPRRGLDLLTCTDPPSSSSSRAPSLPSLPNETPQTLITY